MSTTSHLWMEIKIFSLHLLLIGWMHKKSSNTLSEKTNRSQESVALVIPKRDISSELSPNETTLLRWMIKIFGKSILYLKLIQQLWKNSH